jgi:hypothetical protein
MRLIDTYVPNKLIGTIIADTGLELHSIIRNEIKLYGNDADLNHIDTSHVQSLFSMFWGLRDFNGDVSLWDVSKVFNFDECFAMLDKFNCDISQWNVSRGDSFRRMFFKCSSFNRDLSLWNIKSSNAYLYQMYYDCPAPKPRFVIEQESCNKCYNVVK